MNNALGYWRERFGIDSAIAASVLGISCELLARIECGEVEPAPQLAVRIHIVTAGMVPISAWGERVRLQLVDGHMEVNAVPAKQAGEWGVNLYLGCELVSRMDASEASRLASRLHQAAELAGAPPMAIAAE